jgi:RHS repeat-associated protein
LTNSAKGVISRTKYEPYGTTADGSTPAIGFTGHVNAPDLGLVYMQQRYYDPVAGRFLSIDPVTTDANTGGSFNRYAYAANNPYKYVDPDGRDAADKFGDQFKKDAEAGNSKIYEPFAIPAVVVTGAMLVLPAAAAVVIAGAPTEAVVGTGVLAKIGTPLIKAGASGGKTAGKAFPNAVRDAAKAENPTKTCVYCRMEGKGTQVDHAIPKARGGDATLENAQMACPHCNASKGARDLPVNPPPDYTGAWPPTHW